MSTAEFLKYLEETKSSTTLQQYRTGINLFSKFFRKNSDEILKLREQDVASGDPVQKKRFSRELEKFHAWLLKPIHTIQGKKNRAYGLNSARNYCIGIQQLFKFYEMGITLPAQSKVGKTVVSTRDFPLIPTILRRMYDVADLRERVLLSMAKDLAWRVGDFMKIRVDELPDLEQEPPLALEKVTEKQDIIAKSFLSAETVELLKIYLPTLNKENPYLFQSNHGGYLQEKQINRLVKDLAEKAHITIPTNKRLRFHAFRKLFLSTCANLSIDVNMAKLMCGKSVDKSMLAYLNGVELRNSFQKYAKSVRLSEKVETTAKEREEVLVQMIEEQNKKIQALETFLRAKPARKIDTSEAHILELQEKIVFLEEMLGKVIKQLESMGVPRGEIG